MLDLHMPSKNPVVSLRAPSSGSSAALRLPSRDDPPAVDDHVVRPETREEMVRGRRLEACPALEPHGDAHGQLAFVVRGHARPGFRVANDLLTRVSRGSDFATDTSVRKEGIDPTTGRRHLEELSFEVVHTQSQRDITERAEELTARGVRRVFAIEVLRNHVTEWDPAVGTWRPLAREATIEDESLVRPLPVRALLDAAASEDAVAHALVDKHNPVIEASRQESRREGLLDGRREGLLDGRREGLLQGRREAIARLCEALEIELTRERLGALEGLEANALEALSRRIAREHCWPA